MPELDSYPIEQVDIVVPVYNEAEAVAAFHAQLIEALADLPYQFSIYYINDGSSDQTAAAIKALLSEDARITLVNLSRNFGHQAALTAGLDRADGDVVISLDGDGQNPPHLIPEMLALAAEGYDLVLMQRDQRGQLGFFKNLTSRVFYWGINRFSGIEIVPGAADFRLMSRRAALAFREMREYHRFLRGMVSWMGFSVTTLTYQPQTRLAGESKYSLRKMVRLAQDALFSFSLTPLFLMVFLGVMFLVLSGIEIIYVLSFWVRGLGHTLAPGWSSLMFVLLFVGGSMMVSLGIVGIYIGNIFQEVKRRPIYFVKSVLGQAGEDDDQ